MDDSDDEDDTDMNEIDNTDNTDISSLSTTNKSSKTKKTKNGEKTQLLVSTTTEEDILALKSKRIDDIKKRYLCCFHCFSWGAPMLVGFPFMVVFVADLFLCEKELWARLFILFSRLVGDIGKTIVYVLLELVALVLRFLIFYLSLRIKKKVYFLIVY